MHVRPSTNTSFPTCPCHTLSEYVRHPGKYFNDSNLTLQFLPGNQTLDVNVTKTSIHQLELLGNSSAAVTTTVACSSKVGLSFRHISKVRIDCLAFVCVPDHARFTLVMIMTQPMQAVPKIWVYHFPNGAVTNYTWVVINSSLTFDSVHGCTPALLIATIVVVPVWFHFLHCHVGKLIFSKINKHWQANITHNIIFSYMLIVPRGLMVIIISQPTMDYIFRQLRSLTAFQG